MVHDWLLRREALPLRLVVLVWKPTLLCVRNTAAEALHPITDAVLLRHKLKLLCLEVEKLPRMPYVRMLARLD